MVVSKLKKDEKGSVKNYCILTLIVLCTVFIVWYICRWYQVYSEYEMQTPVIRETLSYEIGYLEFDHYIMENPNSVIYMCTASDIDCRNFEKDLKKYVVKNNLQNDIIYLNLSDADLEKFVENFNNNYKYKIKLTNNYPAIVEFTDGSVTGILQGSDSKRLSITKVSQFIDLHHIGDNDE